MTWRGLGFDAAIVPIAALLVFSVLFAAIAIWRFDWEEPHTDTDRRTGLALRRHRPRRSPWAQAPREKDC